MVNIMPRQPHTRVPQPVFHEPNFAEDVSRPDPTGFETEHPSDNAVYDEVKDLLKKDVVSFEKSRGADDDLFQLEHAYGSTAVGVLELKQVVVGAARFFEAHDILLQKILDF